MTMRAGVTRSQKRSQDSAERLELLLASIGGRSAVQESLETLLASQLCRRRMIVTTDGKVI